MNQLNIEKLQKKNEIMGKLQQEMVAGRSFTVKKEMNNLELGVGDSIKGLAMIGLLDCLSELAQLYGETSIFRLNDVEIIFKPFVRYKDS